MPLMTYLACECSPQRSRFHALQQRLEKAAAIAKAEAKAGATPQLGNAKAAAEDVVSARRPGKAAAGGGLNAKKGSKKA